MVFSAKDFFLTGLTGLRGYFYLHFQFPDEIENTKSLREKGSGIGATLHLKLLNREGATDAKGVTKVKGEELSALP